MECFNVAILGFGTVGSGVYRILTENSRDILHREDLALSVRHILVRDPSLDKPGRSLAPSALFTTDYEQVLRDGSVSIVIECIGGVEPARSYILDALKRGKTVVTANKEVMSKHWFEFENEAKKTGAGLYLEATVGGGIPILRTITDSMQANNIQRVMGIINGTTNYILTRMDEEGGELSGVLADAQRLGYAEADPTADVEGFDAMYKLSILSSLAFHAHMPIEVIHREGITKLTKADFDTARALGYRIKLLAIGKKQGTRIEVRVHPTMIPVTHPLASIRGVYNAILLTGHAVGDVMLYGRGAGCLPTASAVVSDLIYACHHQGRHRYTSFVNQPQMSGEIELVSDFRSVYCLRLHVADRPGAMAAIAGCFAAHGVSLKSVLQLNEAESDGAHITFLTHEAGELAVRDAVSDVLALECVYALESMIRAED